MERTHRCPTFMLIVLLCAGLIGGMGGPAASAQIVPIQSGDASTAPPELVVDGMRFQEDRQVTVDVNPLQELTDESGQTVYRKPGESDPLGAIYVLEDSAAGNATRYLPEFIGDASAVCPAERIDAGTLQGEDATYVAAGPETDMTADQLTEIGSTDEGQTIYAYTSDQPFDEVLVGQSQGEGNVPLVRYVLVDAAFVPAVLGEGMSFAGTQFVPAAGETATFDGLIRVGCAGLFPAWAVSAELPLDAVTLDVGGQAVLFRAAAPEATAPPAESTGTPLPQTPVATSPPASPTDVPPTATMVPTQEPTVLPTPTVVPPTSTAVPPTATVAPPTETTVPPTATATEVLATEALPTAAPPTATSIPPTAVLPVVTTEEALPTEVPPTPAPGTPEATLPPARPNPTRVPLQPQAVVPTVPPEAPSPPAARVTGIQCTGTAGAPDANGVPGHLPRTLQYAGSGYRYSGKVTASDAGPLTDVGCAGTFIISTVVDEPDTLYLRLADASESLFRFEKTASFAVRSEVTEQPRSIQAVARDDLPAVTYRAGESLVPSVYSSVSLVLYVPDTAQVAPDRILAYAVGADVIGVYVPEGAGEPGPAELLDRAEESGVHASLLLGGQRYVLTGLWTPFGTTTNGWLTLYGPEGDATPDQLAGLDPRQENLILFDRRD